MTEFDLRSSGAGGQRPGGILPSGILRRLGNKISCRVWVLAYALEEARQRYAGRRQLFRQACACIALDLLRVAR